LNKRLADGKLRTTIHSAADDVTESRGFALYYSVQGKGKGVQVLHLAPGFKTLSDLTGFIDQMDREKGGRVFSIEGFFGEFGDRTANRGLSAAGFIPIERVRLWINPQHLRCVVPNPRGRYLLRVINPHDRSELVRLFVGAYHGHVDSLFAMPRKEKVAASEFIDYMFSTSKEGRLLRSASFILKDPAGRKLVGAVFVREASGFAYVADLMVDPRHQRRGIGTFLLVRALEELRRKRHRYVEIMTTLQNPTRSPQLYWRLGFRPVRGTSNKRIRLWVRSSEMVRTGIRFREPAPSERRRFLVR
jgi:ribosomal protein S18 acetylase RimI-like enzyme